MRATVDAQKCSGCRICNNLCPFNAIIFHEDLMISRSTTRFARVAALQWRPARPVQSVAAALAMSRFSPR
ncbi:MAG: 4Fe-4S binding protein [Chloroflexota bacterium]